jgi:hypothetical protein
MADHYRLTANKLARQLVQSIKFIFGPAVFDHNAGALDVARFTQATTEAHRRASWDPAQAPHPFALLRARRERSCSRRAAERGNFRRPMYDITL